MTNDPKDTRINLRISKSWKQRFEKYVEEVNALLGGRLTAAGAIKNMAWFQRLLWEKSPYVSENSSHILLIRNREYIYYKVDNLLINKRIDQLNFIPMYVSMKSSIIRRVRNEEKVNALEDELARAIKSKWKLNLFWLYDRKDESLVASEMDPDGLTYKYVELKTHPRLSLKLRRESLVVLDFYGKEAASREEWSHDTASFEADIPSKNMQILVVFQRDGLEHGGEELVFELANREGVVFNEERAKRLLMDDPDFDFSKEVTLTKIKKLLGKKLSKKSSQDKDFIYIHNQYIKKMNDILIQHDIHPFPDDINDENLAFYGLKVPMPPTDLVFRLKWPTPVKK